MKQAAPILLAGVFLAQAVPAWAGDTSARMAVSLSVSDGCSISASPMEFAMEAQGGAPVLAQASVALACSPKTTYEIAIDRGGNAAGSTRHMADPASGALVAYEVYSDAARTARWGDRPGNDTVGGHVDSAGPVVHTAYGEVTRGAEQIAAGAYSDILVVTVSF